MTSTLKKSDYVKRPVSTFFPHLGTRYAPESQVLPSDCQIPQRFYSEIRNTSCGTSRDVVAMPTPVKNVHGAVKTERAKLSRGWRWILELGIAAEISSSTLSRIERIASRC